VPLRTGQIAAAPDLSDGNEWSLAKAVLHQEDPAIYTAWIAALTRGDRAGGRLTLTAPSRFHANYVLSHLKPRLLAACRDVDDQISDIVVLS
jgi:chromosomal replication initiation ATPase DnaA